MNNFGVFLANEDLYWGKMLTFLTRWAYNADKVDSKT